MTVKTLAVRIGDRVMVRTELGGVRMTATIEDVKVSYGQIRCLIRPVEGSGSAWVHEDRLQVANAG